MIKVILNITLISIVTMAIMLLINDKKYAKKIVIMMAILAVIEDFIIAIFYTRDNCVQFAYEIFCWGLIAFSFILKGIRHAIKNKNFIAKRIEISKKEKILMAFSIVIGVISLIICTISNNMYILPYNEYEELANCYFNADVHRSTLQLFDITGSSSEIHPLYRFIMLPITIIFIMINIITNNSNICSLANAYLACTIQIALNSISILVFYNILKQIKLKENICFIGSIIFSICISNILLSIIPETYAITLFTMLCMIYLYIKNNLNWIVFAILAVGANLMCILPLGIILMDIFIKNKKKFKKQIVYGIYFLVIVVILAGVPIVIHYSNYILSWADDNNIINKIGNSLNQLWITLICGPDNINITPYFVQSNDLNLYGKLILIALVPAAIIGVIYKRNELVVKLGVIQLLAAGVLHVIVGYGANNGLLYAPLYSWAFIIFIASGFDYIYKKVNKKYILYIFGLIVSVILIYNICWISKFAIELHNQQFTLPSEKRIDSKLELYYDNGEIEHFYVIASKIIQMNTGKTIVKDIDTYTYTKDKNVISGVLKDSRWFKIEIENNRAILTISEKSEILQKEKFYIFGMGLRDKYILRKTDNNLYELIKYKDKSIVIDNLKLDYIDYENYTVHAKDMLENEIIISEDEDRIYIKNNNDTNVLQDNIKINIPTFDNYEHKYQLRVLFNEVMINITEDGPKPNFIAYSNVWYRDAAIMAMVLEKTNNINQIENWIMHINKMYDNQNDGNELDNLGQLLYLSSLTENKNDNLILEIQKEIEKNVYTEGYLNGITDGAYHPVYQTKWLIFGLKKLGLDYSKYTIPNLKDSYSQLVWFCDEKSDGRTYGINKRWQYIEYASLHFNKKKIDFDNKAYPLSLEYRPSKANFENMNIIGQDFVKTKLVVPHGWAAAEMFLYLIDLDEGNI